MGDQLKPDTCEKMRALCKRISVAHNLDAGIQEELYAHMEDKLLAYIDGDETLAEEDALILVREHFGDPSQVKALFQEVHRYETNVSLSRRLAAAMIVTMAVTVICHPLGITLLRLPPEELALAPPLAVLACVYVLTSVFSWFFLWRWQRRLDMGHTPWFLTWHPAYLACSIAALLVLESHTSTLLMLYFNSSYANSMLGSFAMWPRLHSLVITLIMAYPMFMCMAWLWWCDRPPRQARAVGTAAGWWAIWMLLLSATANTGGVMKWASSSSTAQFPSIATSIAFSFAFVVGYALVACMLYKAGQYTLSHTLGKRP